IMLNNIQLIGRITHDLELIFFFWLNILILGEIRCCGCKSINNDNNL
ncbi:single-stranded DNA-binding protein, partial ['Chrysanthemum coronarium' phytoplasma]